MNFKDFSFAPELLKAVAELGFEELTPIQEQCIPEIRKGHDVIGQSKTGSGKTAAFGLPILEKIRKGEGIQVLVLTPTRELCVQVSDSMESFSKYLGLNVASVYGGVSYNPQKDAIRRAEIVVGTPGRTLDHLRQGSISFEKVKFFVLDETDRMCDMGFYDDVEKILSQVHGKRQMLLFSATITSDVQKLVRKHLKNPVTIKSSAYVEEGFLDQKYFEIAQEEKFSLLVHFLKNNRFGLSLVFCGTRREVDAVARNIKKNGIEAMAIHGGLPQGKRSRALDALKSEHIDVLIATDVAARGLDLRNVSYIYNYDVPKTAEEYIHRIGRTARAGDKGFAITLLTPRDHDNFRSVLRDPNIKIEEGGMVEFEKVQFERRQQSPRSGFGRPSRGPGNFGGRGGHSGGRSSYGPSRGSGYGRPSHGYSGGSAHSSSSGGSSHGLSAHSDSARGSSYGGTSHGPSYGPSRHSGPSAHGYSRGSSAHAPGSSSGFRPRSKKRWHSAQQ